LDTLWAEYSVLDEKINGAANAKAEAERIEKEAKEAFEKEQKRLADEEAAAVAAAAAAAAAAE
jgi:hypothetical protein